MRTLITDRILHLAVDNLFRLYRHRFTDSKHAFMIITNENLSHSGEENEITIMDISIISNYLGIECGLPKYELKIASLVPVKNGFHS